MTADELRALIESDAEAKALAETGAADLCAARCRAIARKVTQLTKITELTILSLYENPQDGEFVMQTIETVADTNPVVRRILKWLQPNAPGVDMGDPRVRQLLVTSVASGGVGLSPILAAPMLAVAEVEPQISGADVSTAWPFGVQE